MMVIITAMAMVPVMVMAIIVILVLAIAIVALIATLTISLILTGCSGPQGAAYVTFCRSPYGTLIVSFMEPVLAVTVPLTVSFSCCAFLLLILLFLLGCGTAFCRLDFFLLSWGLRMILVWPSVFGLMLFSLGLQVFRA